MMKKGRFEQRKEIDKMLERVRGVSGNGYRRKLAACLGLVLSALVLLLFGEGFPPLPCRLLFQVLPQIPRLIQSQGFAIVVALFGLITLSLAFLVLWIIVGYCSCTLLFSWSQKSHHRQYLRIEQEAAKCQGTERYPPVSPVQTIPPTTLAEKQTAVVAGLQLHCARNAPHAMKRTTSETQMSTIPLRRKHLHVVACMKDDGREEIKHDTVPLEMMHKQQRKTLHFHVGMASDPGVARKDMPNEDHLLAIQATCITPEGPQPVGLFVVADGMGGHAHGQEASRGAIQAFSEVIVPALLQSIEDEELFADLLKAGIHRANLTVYQHNRGQEHMMSTTMTAALLVGAEAYIANIGDSRTYIYRKNKHELVQVTQDHSRVAHVEEGSLSPDGIHAHPRRKQIYRCLGEHASVRIDLFRETLAVGDELLLCSDGLWEMVRHATLEKLMCRWVSQPSHACDMLLEEALRAGGADNVSLVVVGVEGR